MQRRVTRRRGIAAVGALFLAVLLSSCGYSVPSDMVAVQVGAGPFEASKVKGCKEASDRGFWTNDDYNYFPTSEREWDATGQDGSDSGRFKSVTKDSVEMYIPVTVRFTLKTDCETLTDFYTSYARRYGVKFENDGSYNDAWITLLRKLVADPSDATLDRIIQNYNWRAVWNDPTTKTEIERELDEALTSDTSLLVQTANAAYFENISVLVGKPEPVNEDLSAAVALEQTKVAEAQSAEAQAKADEAKARAQIAVAKAEAAKQQAEIKGYGSEEVYVCLKLAEQGLNCKQPQYIVGGAR